MGRIIVVVSGKGGTGKTTTVGAIGSCLSAMGAKTLCVDCDFGLRNLDINLGLTNRAVANLKHVMTGVSDLQEACTKHPEIDNLWFLSAPPTYEETLDAVVKKKFLDEVRENFDFCLLDAPAGIGNGFRFAATGADMAIIVVNGDNASMRDGQVVAEKLRELEIPDIRLLVNRVQPEMFKAEGETIDNIIDTVGVQLLGIVREDPQVVLASNFERPLILFSRKSAAKGFSRIAQRIMGRNVPVSTK